MMETLQGKLETICRDIQGIVVIGSVGTVLLGLFFYWFCHRPLVAATEEYEGQYVKHVREVTEITNFQNAHLNFKEYREEVGKREKRVQEYLPADIGQGEFIQTIERLAIRNKMQLDRISPQKLVPGTQINCQPIQVGVTGSYFGLLKFLQGLQNGARLVVIENMSVKVNETNLAVDMLLNIYAVPAK